MKDLVKFGNAKLPKSTMVFNMGSSKDCPSRLLGLCSCDEVCYARQPEIQYPAVLPYRERQADYWKSHSSDEICVALAKMIRRKRNPIKRFRFNESGDFYTQNCVDKLSNVAVYLKQEFGIETYGYTARKDLDFSDVAFLVKGSNNEAGNNGKAIVVETAEDVPEGFVKCFGDCKVCHICSVPSGTPIAFVQH